MSSFVVTKTLSEAYYRGLPSQPPLIATTKPQASLFDAPTGPEAYSILKELRCLGDHPLATVWDHGLATTLCRCLTTMGINWSCLDAVHISNVGEPSGPPIVWIGVDPGTLNFEEGNSVVMKCHNIIDNYNIHDYYVEIRESHVMRQSDNRFFDPVPMSNPTFAARDPYTATLGIPISTKNRSSIEGTGGFYLSAGGDNKNIYLVTARHVVLPINDANKDYYRRNESMSREEVIILGPSAFDKKLAEIDDEIEGQEALIAAAKEGIASVDGMYDAGSVTERTEAEKVLEAAEKDLEALKTLRHEIATYWAAKEDRVFGEVIWAPPISLSTEPGQYTLDLAIIKMKAGKLDAKNYRGNTINIGRKYLPHKFMKKVYLHSTSSTSFKFPSSRLVMLRDQVPERDLTEPSTGTLDANGDPCLVVFKNGAASGTTIGRANNVSSYTRNYFAGQYQESREWPIIPTDKYSEPFSIRGDSGSCVADAYGRVGGIITGGSGYTKSSDITYVTPISFIMKVLHNTSLFKHAHLNPSLA